MRLGPRSARGGDPAPRPPPRTPRLHAVRAVSAVATALTRTCLSSLFSTAVPVADSGTALSVLDVCQSAVGVVSPLYGGFLMSHLGFQAQPVVAASHYAILLGLSALTLARNARAEKKKDE